jgi:hypothetical protein
MRRGFIPIVVCLAGLFIGAVAPSLASAEGTPAWRITAESVPTNIAPSGTGVLSLQVQNVGDAPSVEGSPITVVAHLPQGMTASQGGAYNNETFEPELSGLWGECEIGEAGHLVTCTYQAGATIAPVSSSIGALVGDPHGVAPPIAIETSLEPFASGSFSATATVSGGGASLQASDTASIHASSALAPFGLETFHQWSTNVDGSRATQAGSHPFETATSFTLNKVRNPNGTQAPNEVLRNLHLQLPAGFVGNPTVVPRCPRADFDKRREGGFNPVCPTDTQVGVANVTLAFYVPNVAVYNLVPPAGVAAQFGVGEEQFVAFIDANVRPNAEGEYTVSVDANDIQTHGLNAANVFLWGDPADPSHNRLRHLEGENAPSYLPSGLAPRPFLSLPTSCGVPQTLTVSAVAWEDPLQTQVPFAGTAASTDEQNNPVSMEGCSKLDFSPSLELAAETTSTDTPTGLEVNLRVPQNEDPNGLAEADLKSATVTLPPGLTLSPSAANGLEACSPAQIGLGSVQEKESQPTCPAASKVADLEVTTPLLEHPLQGEVYLAQQETVEGSLIGAYLVVDDPLTGILIKLPGKMELGGQAGATGLQPGQVRAIFANSPQFPFSDLKLKFFGGPRAALVTPSTCGASTATTQITGWNGTLATPASNPVPIDSGCTQGFSPAFVAGTTSNVAGAYSPMSLSLSRGDSEQNLSGLSFTLPPGLLGKLAGVPQCSNAQANGGACPESSRLGTVTVSAGAGPEPLYVQGEIYLTGPYKGAPFGESVEVPAIAGPFNLDEDGRPVVVRGAIRVNPTTAQATVVSDPLPSELKGIQLDERFANVTIDRPNFIFNPTNCGQTAVAGTITSTQHTVANVSSNFKATNCSSLKFKPGFVVSTAGRASKADGASLDVKVTYPNGPEGTYANIKSVKVDLPKQLPARLTTLQKACLAATFEANPARCPAASAVGTVTATTPILAHALTGPAFLVSHGNEAFPDLELVLQGEGVTLILDGNTSIKKGITSNTFKTIPDAPVSSFELKLPVGPYAVLGANVPQSSKYSLCNQTLAMPTAITGQNGAVIKQTTKITATGCTPVPDRGKPKKAKKATRSKRPSHGKGRR